MHLKQSTFLMIFTQMLIKSYDQILTLMQTVFHFSCCSTDLMLIVSWTVSIAFEKKAKSYCLHHRQTPGPFIPVLVI